MSEKKVLVLTDQSSDLEITIKAELVEIGSGTQLALWAEDGTGNKFQILSQPLRSDPYSPPSIGV